MLRVTAEDEEQQSENPMRREEEQRKKKGEKMMLSEAQTLATEARLVEDPPKAEKNLNHWRHRMKATDYLNQPRVNGQGEDDEDEEAEGDPAD